MFEWIMKKMGLIQEEKEEIVKKVKENRDTTWNIKEFQPITLVKGEMADSKRAVFAYLNYDMETINVLTEKNKSWLSEEISTYPMTYTMGGILIHRPIPYRLPDREETE